MSVTVEALQDELQATITVIICLSNTALIYLAGSPERELVIPTYRSQDMRMSLFQLYFYPEWPVGIVSLLNHFSKYHKRQ